MFTLCIVFLANIEYKPLNITLPHVKANTLNPIECRLVVLWINVILGLRCVLLFAIIRL